MKLQRSFLRTVGQRLLVVSLLLASPVLAQESYLAVEAHSGKVLIELNADTKRPVASLTKIATAMVVIDWSELSGSSMGQMAVVPPEAAYLGGSNPMGMIPGDRIALRDAMYSMLLGSDNVAAQTLADHVGRSIITRAGGSDPVGSFVGEMNNLARAIGMTRTKFANPHGMDTARQKGTSTARDMARLSIYAMRNTGMQYYTKQTARSIGSYRGNARRGFKIKNVKMGSPVFIRAFKEERELELWMQEKDSDKFVHLRTYPIVAASGNLGPKQAEGDYQVPEGFYYVPPRMMNPNSRFHLAFNIGYPNEFDRSHGRTGSFIMVHGSNISIGCLAMTDEKIEEIYTLCNAAHRGGQKFFRVHIFPFHMTAERMTEAAENEWLPFWVNLEKGYRWFEEKKTLPNVTVVEKEYRFGEVKK
ncbi:serine hydrolase [Akkermansiaceae bacterium]|nr:serine hydrolase [Akkermansiaceae bacterium]